MKFDYEDRLTYEDLTYKYQSKLVEMTRNKILNDLKLMTLITGYCEDGADCPVDGDALKNAIDLKVADMANKAVDQIRMYFDFEIEVSEADL